MGQNCVNSCFVICAICKETNFIFRQLTRLFPHNKTTRHERWMSLFKRRYLHHKYKFKWKKLKRKLKRKKKGSLYRLNVSNIDTNVLNINHFNKIIFDLKLFSYSIKRWIKTITKPC